jgi:hypothetical protein
MHSYAAPGTYTVTLTVTDNSGQQASSSQSVTVVPAPTASFTISPDPALDRTTVNFNASASSAPGGVITSYNWNFGDGTTATTASPTVSHSYATNGSYTVGLTITDNHGQFAVAAHTETINLPTLRGGLNIPKKQKLARVLKHGLRIAMSPSERLTATFLITTKVRGPHGKRTPVTLLRSRPRGFNPGAQQVFLKFNPKAAKKLVGLKTVFLTVKLTLTDQFGQQRTTTLRVTLKR